MPRKTVYIAVSIATASAAAIDADMTEDIAVGIPVANSAAANHGHCRGLPRVSAEIRGSPRISVALTMDSRCTPRLATDMSTAIHKK